MRKLINSFVLTSALATTALFAQTTTAPAHGPRMAPTPAVMAAHRVASMTSLLTLTADQQSRATTIFSSAATASSTTHASLKALQTQLSAAIKSNNTGAINTLSTQIGTLHGQLTAGEANASAAFYQILTPAQQATLATSHRGMGLMGGLDHGPGPGAGQGARFHGPHGGAAAQQ